VASTFLKELSSNYSLLFFVCDQILHLILLLNLTELGGNRSWFIGDQVLEHSSRDIVLHKGEGGSILLSLSELDGDWCWLIGDEVLKHGGGDVVLHKSEGSSILLSLSKLDGDWCWLIGDEILEHGS